MRGDIMTIMVAYEIVAMSTGSAVEPRPSATGATTTEGASSRSELSPALDVATAASSTPAPDSPYRFFWVKTLPSKNRARGRVLRESGVIRQASFKPLQKHQLNGVSKKKESYAA